MLYDATRENHVKGLGPKRQILTYGPHPFVEGLVTGNFIAWVDPYQEFDCPVQAMGPGLTAAGSEVERDSVAPAV
jgi:hypothetical protein